MRLTFITSNSVDNYYCCTTLIIHYVLDYSYVHFCTDSNRFELLQWLSSLSVTQRWRNNFTLTHMNLFTTEFTPLLVRVSNLLTFHNLNFCKKNCYSNFRLLNTWFPTSGKMTHFSVDVHSTSSYIMSNHLGELFKARAVHIALSSIMHTTSL